MGRVLYSLVQGKESDLDGHILTYGTCSVTPNESEYWTRCKGDACFWGGGHCAKGSISRVPWSNLVSHRGCFSELRLRIDVSWGKNVLARGNSKYRSPKTKEHGYLGKLKGPLYQNPNSREAACSLLSIMTSCLGLASSSWLTLEWPHTFQRDSVLCPHSWDIILSLRQRNKSQNSSSEWARGRAAHNGKGFLSQPPHPFPRGNFTVTLWGKWHMSLI